MRRQEQYIELPNVFWSGVCVYPVLRLSKLRLYSFPRTKTRDTRRASTEMIDALHGGITVTITYKVVHRKEVVVMNDAGITSWVFSGSRAIALPQEHSRSSARVSTRRRQNSLRYLSCQSAAAVYNNSSPSKTLF